MSARPASRAARQVNTLSAVTFTLRVSVPPVKIATKLDGLWLDALPSLLDSVFIAIPAPLVNTEAGALERHMDRVRSARALLVSTWWAVL